MRKLKAAKLLFDIGKTAAEIYSTIAEGRKKNSDSDKNKKIAELEEENRQLKEKLKKKRT